jgi:hypothetical protein
MPSQVHQVALVTWTTAVFVALWQLTPSLHATMPPGLEQQVCLIEQHNPSLGLLPAYELGQKKKQADAGIAPHPNPSGFPSVVLEVGSSESLTLLRIDARLWFEHLHEVSQLFPLLPFTHQIFFRFS